MKPSAMIFIIPAVAVCCGFTWGFKQKDPCVAARNALDSVMSKQGEKLTPSDEDKILAACPAGAPGLYVQAVRSERDGDADGAIDSYRAAVRLDDTLYEAHGRLGLLLYGKKETAEAGVELTKGLAGRPEPEWHRALGMILLDGRMYALARYHLGEALKTFVDDVGIMEGIAVCQEHLGDLSAAEESYRAVLARRPDSEEARLGLARTYLSSGRPGEARKLIEPLAATTDRRAVHELLARIYREKGLIPQAEAEYKRSGTTVEIPLDEYVRKGDAFFLRREYERAITAYTTALSHRPDWAEVLEKIGDTYNASGRDDDAFDFYLQATKQRDASPSAWYSLGLLYERKGKLDAAVSAYRTSLVLDYENGDTRRRLADIYTLRGDFQRASEEYRALIKLRPDNPLLHFNLARIFDKAKKYPDAIREYLEAIRINADNIEAHREVAALYLKRNMLKEAETHYRAVLRLRNTDNEARNALIVICVRKKEYDTLLTLLNEAARLNPDDPDSYYRLGQFYEFRKNYAVAIQNYDKAIELKQDHVKAWNALGRVYMKTGDRARAMEAIKTAKGISPQLPETIELLNEVQKLPAAGKRKNTKKHGH